MGLVRIEHTRAGQDAGREAEQRFRNRHENVRRMPGHSARIALGDHRAPMDYDQAVGVGREKECIEIELRRAVREGERGKIGGRRRQDPDVARRMRDIGRGDDLAHMLKAPPVEGSRAPVGERDLAVGRRRKPGHQWHGIL
jgi:hypothetical protein